MYYMSSKAEAAYDGFLSNVESIIGKIDIELALQVMLFERKLPDAYPMVELEIHYEKGIDISSKVSYFRDKYGFLVASHGENQVFAKGGMNMAIIQSISQ